MQQDLAERSQREDAQLIMLQQIQQRIERFDMPHEGAEGPPWHESQEFKDRFAIITVKRSSLVSTSSLLSALQLVKHSWILSCSRTVGRTGLPLKRRGRTGLRLRKGAESL